MTTQIAPKASESRTINGEPRAKTMVTTGVVANAQTPVDRDNLLDRLAHEIVEIYDLLAGPPMTQRERVRQEISTYDRRRSPYLYY